MSLGLQRAFLSTLSSGASVAKKLGKQEPKIDNKAYKTAMTKTNQLQQQKDAQRVAIKGDTPTSLGNFGELNPKLQALITKQMEAENG